MKSVLSLQNPSELNALEATLKLWCPEVKVVGRCDNASGTYDKIMTQLPNLIIIEIELPDKTAFELLKEFPDPDFEIIFVTSYRDFMSQAFRFSPVDYLLKPIDTPILIEAIKRAKHKMTRSQKHFSLSHLIENIHIEEHNSQAKLCINSVKGVEVILVDEILYCESDSNYTNFYIMGKKPICASRPLHEFEKILKNKRFFRIHKSFLVNLDHIERYVKGDGGTLVMNDGKELEVSRRKKAGLLSNFKEIFGYI